MTYNECHAFGCSFTFGTALELESSNWNRMDRFSSLVAEHLGCKEVNHGLQGCSTAGILDSVYKFANTRSKQQAADNHNTLLIIQTSILSRLQVSSSSHNNYYQVMNSDQPEPWIKDFYNMYLAYSYNNLLASQQLTQNITVVDGYLKHQGYSVIWVPLDWDVNSPKSSDFDPRISIVDFGDKDRLTDMLVFADRHRLRLVDLPDGPKDYHLSKKGHQEVAQKIINCIQRDKP